MATQTYVNGVTLSDATEFNRFDSLAYMYLTGVAGTNTITATGPANMTLATPQVPFVLVPAVTNSGAATLNITPSGGAALGAKNVFCNGIACVGGELRAGVPAILIYDGTQFQLLGPLAGGSIPGDLAVNGGDLTTTATTFNLLNTVATTINAFGAATSASLGADAGNFTVRGILSGTFKPRVNNSYTPGDTTPSVLDSGILSISNAGAVTITQFDDGVTGQIIYLIFEDANTTINRANCVLAGGVNFTSSANDVLVLIKTATVWAEVCRSVNS